ncbi:MAG TPA: phosphate ABC transporter permease PstA [Sulfurihydrogenibium azorense]|uniref:Phosphate transport system permease protein PstA n=1 Tax=Sulfurihydrogenibium azorense TaxID=309806 RepID=A0A831YAG2_9AQUI|nr:phosphate ABC transporter permease PstA [Sulfurihydrogenibium azorense]
MDRNKLKRKIESYVFLTLSFLAAGFGLFFLFWILGDLLINGFKYINKDLFTQDPVPPGMEGGGLKHAFIGHIIITAIGTAIGTPIGILAGIYFAEYGRNSKFANFLRNIVDIMVSNPSIVIGAVVYAILIKPVGHFMGFAGGVALALLMIPVIVITTDEMMKLVPRETREAAYALGAQPWQVSFQVVLRAAKVGVLTGVILGVARISGETAPLLFTSFNNNFTTFDPTNPMASLTVTVFQYAMGPYEEWHKQAWAASFILTFAVLMASLIARYIIQRKKY